MQQALRPVHEGAHVLRNLVADDSSGERRGLGTAHLGYPPVLDGDAETARVRTIECTDTGAFDDSHLGSPCGASRLLSYTASTVGAVPIALAGPRPPSPHPW